MRSINVDALILRIEASVLANQEARRPCHCLSRVGRRLRLAATEGPVNPQQHAQILGKPSRAGCFHQTVKKFIAAQDSVTTKKQLQSQLDRFVDYYNTERPHRAIKRPPSRRSWPGRSFAPKGPIIDPAGPESHPITDPAWRHAYGCGEASPWS